MKKSNPFFYYRFNYLFSILTIFLLGMFIAAKNQSINLSNILLCLAYAVIITINSFITDRFLVPNFLYTKRRMLFGFSFCVLIIVSGFVLMPIIYGIQKTWYLVTQNNNIIGSWIFSYFIPLFLALVITTIIQITTDQATTNKQLLALQKEHTETELNFLKSQINPHFLFNALNTVYFQIDKSNSAARNTLLQFTNMLQYQLYECSKHTTPIEKEIAYIQNYLAIQKLRMEAAKYSITLDISSLVKGFNFAPLILICFIENAFKYISHFENSANWVNIQLDMQEDAFIFSCTNSTMQSETKEAADYGGIGLANVKRRLDLLYPNKHTLTLNATPNCYEAILKVSIL